MPGYMPLESDLEAGLLSPSETSEKDFDLDHPSPWEKDLETTWKPRFEQLPNSRKDLYKKITHYNAYIFPTTMITTFYLLWKLVRVTGHYDAVAKPNNQWNWFTVFQTILVTASLLVQGIPYVTLFGLFTPMRPDTFAKSPIKRDYRSLRVCLVTKGTNFETVVRVTKNWIPLQDAPGVRFHVVLDDETKEVQFRQALPSFIQIVVVPSAFTPSKAKYKARALEFYRRSQHLTDRDWVLHLDEESLIDEDTITSCLDFIQRSELDIAMGTLHYNDVNHWKSGFLTTAETLRSSEDFGKYSFFPRMWNKPVLGWMHGSWIVINGAVENDVTWNTDCETEDFWFAYNSKAKGYRFGWLFSPVLEQPNLTFRDFWKQRRRWYTGILSIPSIVVKISLVTGLFGELVAFTAPFYAQLNGNLIIPKWLYLWILWNVSVDIHSLIVASFLQDLTASCGVRWFAMIEHAIKAIVWAPAVRLAQVGALLTCIVKPTTGFAIVAKT